MELTLDEKILIKKVQMNNDAHSLELLIEKYSKFSKKLIDKLFEGHSDYEDMMSIGMFSLLEAIHTVDAVKCSDFESYLYYKIFENIYKFYSGDTSLLNQQDIIHQFETFNPYNFNYDQKEELVYKSKTTFYHYRRWLQKLIFYQDDCNEDICDLNFEENEIRNMILDTVYNLLNKLPEKYSSVIYLRYLSDSNLTLEEIGNTIGVTRQRVDQIITKVMSKLRRKLKVQVNL